MSAVPRLTREAFTIGGIHLVGDSTELPPDFLLLHAGGERRKVWHPVISALESGGYGSLAVDQRGHGESGGTRADGIVNFGKDVAALLRMSRRAMIVVGASLGGFAAMLASTEHDISSYFAAVVLVDVLPAPDPDRVRAFLKTTTPPLDQSPLVGDILSQKALLNSACSEMHCPILFVRAGLGAIRDKEVEEFSTTVQNFSMTQIDDASHLVARDCPSQLAMELIKFAKIVGVGTGLRNS